MPVLYTLWPSASRQIPDSGGETFWSTDIGACYKVSKTLNINHRRRYVSVQDCKPMLGMLCNQVSVEQHATARESAIERLYHGDADQCEL